MPRQRRSKRIPDADAPGLGKLNAVSEGLLYTILVLSPWLFGTTDEWSIWLMNGLSYALGLTALVRRRWAGDELRAEPAKIAFWLRTLAWLNVALLVYIAVEIVNARAVFHMRELRFTYLENFSWLPTTYDRGATITKFFQYLALTCLFWGTRDWLTSDLARSSASTESPDGRLPRKLRRLLWVVAVNAGLLATLAILQRASGTANIFWVFPTRWSNKSSIFGPFAYRGTAATYLNLLWPVILMFAAKIWPRTPANRFEGPHLLLIPIVGLVWAATIVSLSRGGTLVCIGLSGLLLVRFLPRMRVKGVAILAVALIALAGFTWTLAGETLYLRFQKDHASVSERQVLLRNAAQISRDYPAYGVGPGAFGAVYHLYREGMSERWLGYLHNDWLEARMTFGWVGFGLQLGLLGCVIVMAIQAVRSRWGELAEGVSLALLGCGIHAVADFPFQIYAVPLLFTTWVAVLCSLSAKRLTQPAGTEAMDAT